MRTPARTRRIAKLALVAVLLAVVAIFFTESRYGIILGNTRDYDNRLVTVIPQAMGVVPGERVVLGGQTVGEITEAEVTADGKARLVLGLDNTAWPLPTDSTMTLRMGGTIKRTDRFVDVIRGKAREVFSDNGQFPASQFVVPVEYNELFNVFDKDTRKGLNQFFAQGGPAMKNVAEPLHAALDVAPPVLDEAAAVFRDLSYDPEVLSTLVQSTAEVTGAVARSNPGLQTLLQGAATTFGTVADETEALETVLDDAASAFRVDGDMFAHGAESLPRLAALADDLEPALDELDRLVDPLNGTLQQLIDIEPDAVDTLRTVRRAAPTLVTVLSKARTKLMPDLGAISKRAAKQLNCIRPFTPSIISFTQGWGGFFGQGTEDPNVNYLHTLVSLLPFPNTIPLNSAQMHELLPNLEIQNPHAPGQEWNQPWFIPECGITPAGFEAANDPEQNTYDPSGSKLVPYPHE